MRDRPDADRTSARPESHDPITSLIEQVTFDDRNLLPLDASHLHTIAVIGPYARAAETGGGGSSKVKPLYTVTPVEGIKNRAGNEVRVTYAEGLNMPAAVNMARAADVAIVMLGDKEYEGVDHPIYLRGNQNQLATSVIAANPRTVIVVKSGGPVLIPWVNKAPPFWKRGTQEKKTAMPSQKFCLAISTH